MRDQPRDPPPSRDEVLNHADMESTYRMERDLSDPHLAAIINEVQEMREIFKQSNDSCDDRR